MKNLFYAALVLLLIAGCQSQGPERYSTTGPEIDVVKSLVADYEQGNWESWLTKYADTAKVYHNNWDEGITANELKEAFQESLAPFSTYSFKDEPIFYEKVIDNNGKTWVNFWGVWQATPTGSDKSMDVPVHLSVNVEDGKIVEEYGFWDGSIIQNAMAELTAMQNAPEAEQAIMANQAKVAEAWSNYDKELFASAASPNVVRNANGIRIASNLEEYAGLMDVFHSAFPDFNVVVDSYVIRDGKSYLTWTVTGTNTGEFMGNAPTGKAIKTHGMSIWTFDADGKAIQEDAYFDNMELYNQLGYTVSPPAGE
ncbi:nuclear transport factor 2 family protein [Lentiprolixibacter aurantiacus]|uniref:Nuclear transport factor 2 family protein n=1 Tax=Lentiprolixibacter aurantiacus TaxID=2993939 RepID=A0AAE3MMQ0_9FLAO|nr:nuclear transport factor 2 family protein [Lentiprolixibacter aurantiacus]MCX2720289.1 nuclear transport factor 2 family protein [Lentiprolixibacter aurantiacus]